MKKHLLFILPSMQSGGGEKSLLTLLQLIDYEKFDVDLLLMKKSGLFFSMIPSEVKILEFFPDYEILLLPVAKSILTFLSQGKLSYALGRLKYSLALKKGSTPLEAEQLAWGELRRFFINDLPEYDAAVAYLEGNPVYICADCIKAKTKIAYIHSDYTKLGLNPQLDKSFFEKFNYIVAVSAECAAVLKNVFPMYESKIREIHNIVSKEAIEKFACVEQPSEYGNGTVKLLTVGRLSKAKGYELAVEAARLLKESEVNFKWFAIGMGEERASVESLIAENSLENEFVLLGERANPYPYIKNCDIYVQPSRFEGKSIAVDEAKCLAKPIVVTCFSTVFDQISDGKNGMIAEMSGAGIAEKIKKLIDEPQLCETLVANLNTEKTGNLEELGKFYAMIN